MLLNSTSVTASFMTVLEDHGSLFFLDIPSDLCTTQKSLKYIKEVGFVLSVFLNYKWLLKLLNIAVKQRAGSSTDFCRWCHLEADNLCNRAVL